ncbi:MAG: apolipoprotein N-acyltransferase [Spirochaetales bacterium]|nr:apolipoprotein N-acyltransferase [Spirochaetales bacterium]
MSRTTMSPASTIIPLAAFGGALSALALPNELFLYGSPLIGLVALVPLYLAMRRSRSYGAAAPAAAVFGMLAHGLSSYWLWFFKDFRFWTLGSTTLAYGLLYALAGLYLRLAAREGGRLSPLAFALVWTSWEHLKSIGFLAYPWGLIAYSWNSVLPFIQLSAVTGVPGLSFLLAYANGALGNLVEFLGPPPPLAGLPACGLGNGPERAFGHFPRVLRARLAGLPCELRIRAERRAMAAGHLAFVAMLGSLALAYGSIRLATPLLETTRIKAALVQQNTDSWTSGELATLKTIARLTRKVIEENPEGLDLVVWSETSLARPWDDYADFYERTPREDPLAPLVRLSGAWIFTGAPDILDYETFEASNSVSLIDPSGRLVAQYAKTHPVPFAEAIPFWEVDWFRTFIQETVGLASGWVMGTELTVFELPLRDGTVVRFGAPICFEDAFASLNREFVLNGADFLLNLTNDSWSLTDSSEIQHFVAARFRAIETGRTLVRSTNSGVTAVVDPRGRVLDSFPLFAEEARAVDIPVYSGGAKTPYLSFGDWFGSLALFLSGLLALILGAVEPFPRRKHA